MESVTHSRLPSEAYSAIPRKAISGTGNKGGFPARTMYDDVYGGPPNFGSTTFSPRAEDYCEIFSSFHASHASSIPVLDLPAVGETQVGLDVRSSGFSYAEIFGGFDGLDFGIFYEDLLSGQCDDRDGYASEKAWTLADTGTSSEESEPQGNRPILSNEDPYKPFDGTDEFSISYHKVNRTRNEVMLSGTTNLSELHAVRGYSVLYDETASIQKTNPQLQVTDDADLCTNFRNAKMKEDHEANFKSQTANCCSIEQTLVNGLRAEKSLTRNSSCSKKDFLTVSQITLITQPCQVQPPSRPPPTPVDVKKEVSSRFSSTSTQNTCQRISGDNSPPFFDVEIDVGSSASASVYSMQESIVKTQDQLGSVKNLAGKKEVLGGHVKPCPKCVFTGSKGSTQETANILDDLDFEEPQCTYNRSHGRSKVSVNAELIGPKTTHEIHDSFEEDILLDISKRPAVEKHIGETFSSSQWTSSSTISGKQKGIIRSSGPVNTQYFVNKYEPNIGHIFSLDMEVHECALMERKAAIDEVHSQVKTVQEIDLSRDYEAKHKAQKEVYQHMETIRQERAANSKCKRRDVKTGNGSTCTSMKEKKESIVRMVHDCVETKGETSQTNPSLQVQNMTKTRQVQNKITEGEKKDEKQHETENDLKLKEYVRKQGIDKCMDNMEGLKESGRKNDRKQKKKSAFYLGKVDARERQENDMETAEKGLGWEESFKHDEEAHGNDIEKTLQNVNNHKQSGSKSTVATEKDEDHKKSHEGGANEGSPKVSLQNEEILRVKMKLIKEERKKTLTDTLAPEENITRIEAACESDESKNRHEEADSSQTTKKEVCQSKRKQVGEKETKENGENRCNDISILEQERQNEVMERMGRNEEEMGLNSACKIHLHEEYVELMVCDGAWTVEGYDNLQAHSASKHEQNSGNAEGSQVRVTDGECGKGTDSEIWVNKSEAEILKNQAAVRQVCIPSIITEDIERGIFRENEVKISVLFNGNLNNASDTNTCLGLGQMQNGEIENVCQSNSVPINPVMFDNESVGRRKNDQDISDNVNKEELWEKLSSGNSDVNFKNEFKIGATESTLEVKENAQLPPDLCNLSHETERKEKNSNYAPTAEKEYERERREKEMDIDRLRELEEEREREREKDRMAVGRANLEGHGKAYAEAHERAERAALERAAAESRQKLIAEGRVRLEKASEEAKEKSFSGNVEPETRIKADRIAVDRATAEARERASDGVKAEMAALDAREQLERSVSADFSAALRNKGGKPAASVSYVQDEPHQDVGSRFPYSSTGASSFVEKSGGLEGESAKRCRAKLERYRRTAEQAAKALAEKKLRDLLAQKEQAERNRLAETLDAEVKRWSSGKEGNLRALLSTMQYILGPNSGWQPIPLTEVITSAAVKKAYRKATLCVHPDKLQQRGASIQHKYICEKVFDLLKDAWNKFNSEER